MSLAGNAWKPTVMTLGSMELDTTSSTPATAAPHTWLRPRSPRRFLLVDRQLTVSLVTTTVVVTGVLVFWLLGKFAWNHDPQVSQAFLPASFETLTNRPQSAALEFHHALSTGSFSYAKKLVATNALSLVDQAQQACAQACPTPEQSRDKVFTRTTLLETTNRRARVRAESFGKDGTPQRTATYELSREGERWVVVSGSE